MKKQSGIAGLAVIGIIALVGVGVYAVTHNVVQSVASQTASVLGIK